MSDIIDIKTRLKIENYEGFINQTINLPVTFEEATQLYAACCGVAILVKDDETQKKYNALADTLEKIILTQVKTAKETEGKH